VTNNVDRGNLQLAYMKEPICAEMIRPIGRTNAKVNKTSATSKAKVKVRTADAAALALGLERSSNVPLHVQLGRQLRHMILSGRVAPGARLPSTRALAVELGVSRATSVLAYDQLVSEGYLEGRQGSGAFTAPSLGERSLQAAATSRSGTRGSGWRTAPRPAPVRPFQITATDATLFPFGTGRVCCIASGAIRGPSLSPRSTRSLAGSACRDCAPRR
jgi:DNA-binding transcriptional regulator YhcF (GntR family)